MWDLKVDNLNDDKEDSQQNWFIVPCTTLLNFTVWTHYADNDVLQVEWNNTLKFNFYQIMSVYCG